VAIITKKLQSSVVCLLRSFIQKERQTYCKLDANKFKHTTCYLILALSLTAILDSSAFASEESPYDSGYDHGCDDARISDPDDRYINQGGKGPNNHTNEFMNGYNDGYDSCGGGSSEGPESYNENGNENENSQSQSQSNSNTIYFCGDNGCVPQ
jgi:hypothetical protein